MDFLCYLFPIKAAANLYRRIGKKRSSVKEGESVDMKEKITQIIRYVGGKDNVKNAWHCITRLRFELKDNQKIDEAALKKMSGVLGTAFAKDQFQIVIGVGVEKYYEELISQLGLDANGTVEADGSEKRKDFATWFMDVVSGIFGPLVPAIAGTDMIKGLNGKIVQVADTLHAIGIQAALLRLSVM